MWGILVRGKSVGYIYYIYIYCIDKDTYTHRYIYIYNYIYIFIHVFIERINTVEPFCNRDNISSINGPFPIANC